MEQRAVVRFLTLKTLSARAIRTELEAVYGHEALSLAAVKKWRKRFLNGRVSLDDDPRSGRPPVSDLAESVRTLLEETPFISCKRMCSKLRIAKTTCLRVLHDQLGFRKCYFRWIPHALSENQVQCRITFSEELLQVLHHARETNFDNLLTGDESWFYYEYPHDSAWAASRATLPTRTARKIGSKKCLISIIWSTSGIHSLLVLPAGVRYDAEFFCASVLSDVEKNLCQGSRRKTLRGIYLHFDNAPAHNAKRSRQEIARTKATRVIHPAYSPDAAPSDFFLFGHLKREMIGFRASSPEEILCEIRRIFDQIPKETLLAVYNNWIARVEWIIMHQGEYYHSE
jgi:hypothetical protein